MTTAQLAQFVDHTLLKADASEAAIRRLCQEARQWNFWSVCVNPCWIAACREKLKGSPIRVCTVIGFPLGANDTAAKAAEARLALSAGADELDMVLNIGFVKSGRWDEAQQDIQAVVESAEGRIVKVILETGLLSEQEKIRACQISLQARADFVKTSTGFATGGATIEDVRLMKTHSHGEMKVKASGGIRTLQLMNDLILAGADRIGCSSAAQLMGGGDSKSGY